MNPHRCSRAALSIAATLTIASGCHGPSRQDALELATTLMESQPDAGGVSLDSARVYDGISVWSVYFRQRYQGHLPPGALVTVNKGNREVRRIADR